MARPRIHRDWQRPDLDRLRAAAVHQSTVRASSPIVQIDGKPIVVPIPAGPSEIIISETMRDEIIEYIEGLETLIDERIGRNIRENPALTPLQMAAINIEVAAGMPRKRNMGFGMSAKDLADKLSEAGQTGLDGISEDTIDVWRKLPAYRAAYIEGLVANMGEWFRGEDGPAAGAQNP
jgi:hypothetical protein